MIYQRVVATVEVPLYGLSKSRNTERRCCHAAGTRNGKPRKSAILKITLTVSAQAAFDIAAENA